MPQETLVIDKAVTNKAERMAKAGFDGIYIFKHRGREGLQLRVQGGTAAWVVRYKDFTATIGYLYPNGDMNLMGHRQALDMAADVRSILADQPERRKEYIRLRHRGLSHQEALDSFRPNATTWTFEQCVERMIEDREDLTSTNPLKPRSVKDVKTTFKRDSLKEIKKTPASLLTRAEFEEARDVIRKQAGVSPAQKFVAWSRSVFEHMSMFHSGESGIDGKNPWWEMLHVTHKSKAKTRNPEIEDIVRSLILAEQYLDKPLPGRAINKPGVGAGVLAGLWWIVMTAQRGDAAMSLKSYNLAADAERDGWMIAAWEADQMKAGQAAMLPIPPRAMAHINAIRMKAINYGSKQWVFPSDRDPDVHATLSGTYQILKRLAGRGEVIQKKPEGWTQRLKADGTPWTLPARTEKRDLLAENGISWWSAHDVRRRIQSVLDDAGIPGGSSVILAHEVKSNVDLEVSMTQQQREDFMRQRQAKITRLAYGGAQFLKLKGEAMQVWTDALLDEYDRQKAATEAA